MTLTEEELKARLDNPRNLANRFSKATTAQKHKEDKVTVIDKRKIGSHKDRVDLTVEERTLAVAMNRAGLATTRELGPIFGVSQMAISNGNTGKAKVDEERLALLDRQMGVVRDAALDRLMDSLGLLSKEKMESCKPKELSDIAANMGKVIEKTLPKAQRDGAQMNVIVYAPEQKTEKAYRVVEG